MTDHGTFVQVYRRYHPLLLVQATVTVEKCSEEAGLVLFCNT